MMFLLKILVRAAQKCLCHIAVHKQVEGITVRTKNITKLYENLGENQRNKSIDGMANSKAAATEGNSNSTSNNNNNNNHNQNNSANEQNINNNRVDAMERWNDGWMVGMWIFSGEIIHKHTVFASHSRD